MRVAPILLSAILVLVVACDAEQGAQVNPASLQTPGFEGVPIPDQATELTPPSSTDGIANQAFEVRGSTAAEVVAFYEESLADEWTVAVAPGPIGLGQDVQAGSAAEIHMAGWTTRARDLLVTVGPIAGQTQVVQLNLLSGPSGSGVLDVGAVNP
jgi:hypothetical protein